VHFLVPGTHVPPHTPVATTHAFAQTIGVPAGQFPLASQTAELIWVLPEQEELRHLFAGYAHVVVVVPLHCPGQAGSPPQRARAGIAVRCGAPEGTVLHVPTEPLRSHAWHWPAQARSQQTPSMQCPEEHSVSVLQTDPFVRPTQAPALQMGLAVVQSPLVQQFAAGMQAPLQPL
jgi:hypothetical protein